MSVELILILISDELFLADSDEFEILAGSPQYCVDFDPIATTARGFSDRSWAISHETKSRGSLLAVLRSMLNPNDSKLFKL